MPTAASRSAYSARSCIEAHRANPHPARAISPIVCTQVMKHVGRGPRTDLFSPIGGSDRGRMMTLMNWSAATHGDLRSMELIPYYGDVVAPCADNGILVNAASPSSLNRCTRSWSGPGGGASASDGGGMVPPQARPRGRRLVREPAGIALAPNWTRRPTQPGYGRSTSAGRRPSLRRPRSTSPHSRQRIAHLLPRSGVDVVALYHTCRGLKTVDGLRRLRSVDAVNGARRAARTERSILGADRVVRVHVVAARTVADVAVRGRPVPQPASSLRPGDATRRRLDVVM